MKQFMMKHVVLGMAAAFAVTLASAKAGPITYGTYTLTGEAGTGTNRSVCVFDFGSTAYAFGYRWDDSGFVVRSDSSTVAAGTGEALLCTLGDAGTGLGVTVDLSYSPLYGAFVNGISYNGNSLGVDKAPGAYITAWVSSGGTAGPVWTDSQTSLTARLLSDGAWDGYTDSENAWIYSGKDWVINPDAAPGGAFASVTPVPEPAALSLLALGGIVLIRRRRSA